MNRTQFAHHVVHLAQTPLSVKVYCVELVLQGKEKEFVIMPHLALAMLTEVRNNYSRARGEGQYFVLPSTHAEAIDEGWIFEDQDTVTSFLFIDEEYGTVSSIDTKLECNDSLFFDVICADPRKPDAECIAEAAKEREGELLSKIDLEKKLQAKRDEEQ